MHNSSTAYAVGLKPRCKTAVLDQLYSHAIPQYFCHLQYHFRRVSSLDQETKTLRSGFSTAN